MKLGILIERVTGYDTRGQATIGDVTAASGYRVHHGRTGLAPLSCHCVLHVMFTVQYCILPFFFLSFFRIFCITGRSGTRRNDNI